jgi:hypothetical protein
VRAKTSSSRGRVWLERATTFFVYRTTKQKMKKTFFHIHKIAVKFFYIHKKIEESNYLRTIRYICILKVKLITMALQVQQIQMFLIHFDEEMEKCIEIFRRERMVRYQFEHPTYTLINVYDVRETLYQMIDEVGQPPIVIDNDFMVSETERYQLRHLRIRENKNVAICAKVLGLETVSVIFTKPIEIFPMMGETMYPNGTYPLEAQLVKTQKRENEAPDTTEEPLKQRQKV